MAKPQINIWLDNSRPVPDGWVGAETAAACIGKIMSLDLDKVEFNILSLDHDLGNDKPTGTDFCKSFIKHPDRFPNIIYLHTANPKGRDRMEKMLSECIKENNLKTELVSTRMAGTISRSRIDG
jgi:hypothetical protein